MTFTKEDLINLLALIRRANITGQEAVAVAMLIQKIEQGMQEPQPMPSAIPQAKNGHD